MRVLLLAAVAVVAALIWALMPSEAPPVTGTAGTAALTPANSEGGDPGPRGAIGALGVAPGAKTVMPSEIPIIPIHQPPVAARNLRVPPPGVLRARAAMQARIGLEAGQALPQPTDLPASLSKESVQAGVAEAKPAVAECYEQALQGNPELAGRLLIRFTITAQDGEGRLKDAEIVEDGVGNPFLGMCALEALAQARFEVPEGAGEVVVNYPFKLAPAPPDEIEGLDTLPGLEPGVPIAEQAAAELVDDLPADSLDDAPVDLPVDPLPPIQPGDAAPAEEVVE